MSLVSEWFETARSVITSPESFFRDETRRDGFGYPLKFAFISLAIAGILNGLRTGLFQSMGGGMDPALIAGTVLLTPVVGLIGLMISALILHIFVLLLGGERGYSETFAVLEYSSALTPITSLLSFIPLLGALANLLVGIYTLYVEIKGIEVFQEMSTGRAAVAVILPAVIAVILLFVVIFAGMMAIFASQSSLGGITPPA